MERLLKLDTNGLAMRDGGSTSDDFARQATWADYYRDSQRALGRTPDQVHSYSWHFVNIPLRDGTLEAACGGFQKLDPGTAFGGPDPDCIVNKIEQFAAELASGATADDERLLALKFVLHLVGDLHQPLHVADDSDRGGNQKSAVVAGGTPAPLHYHWDTTFVEAVGVAEVRRATRAATIVAALPPPRAGDPSLWLAKPDVRAWAMESHRVAKDEAYGRLPTPDAAGDTPLYRLDGRYVANATRVVGEQLVKAGHRLAALLNDTLGNGATIPAR